MEKENDFRKNLRNELDYQDLTVKELCAKTGIAKATLDCYLGSRATMPLADAAVKIARSLNVSVEYLITGEDAQSKQRPVSIAPETRLVVQAVEALDDADKKFILNMIAALREREECKC